MKNLLLILLISLSLCSKAQWMDVGGGVYHTQSPYSIIRCMVVFDDNLWITGGFDVAGTEMGLVRIATWDGHSWHGVFPGNDDEGNINCFGTYNDGKLYIGGAFAPTPNLTVSNGIGRWNGSGWENFTYGIPMVGIPQIYSLQPYRNKLYAAGEFWNICDSINVCISVGDIASWDGSHWNNVMGGAGGQKIMCLEVYNDELIAGGEIYRHFQYSTVARWNDTSWREIGRYGLLGGGGNTVYDMVVDTLRNLLYVSCSSSWADGDLGYYIVQWDGRRWKFINHIQFQGSQPRLAMYHNDLYMSGIYNTTLPNGDFVSGVMKWNGAEWSGVGGRMTCHNFTDPAVGYLEVFHDTLYFAGNIDHLVTPTNDTIEFNEIARMYAPPDTSCQNLLGNYNKIWAQDTTFFCDDVVVEFDNNTYYYADSWFWDFGDGTTDTTPNPVHVYDTAGQYNVSLVSTYKNCIDTTYKLIATLPCDSLNIWIIGHPDTVVMYNSGGTWAYQAEFQVASSNNMSAFYYYWDMGDGFQDSGFVETANYGYAMDMFRWYEEAGTYIITLVVKQDCCMDTIYDTLVVIDPNAGIDELPAAEVYLGQNIPNPFSNTTIIPYYVPAGTKGSMFITDMNGKLIERFDLLVGRNQLELSMSHFADGVYFYSIKIDGQVKATKKMVLEK